MITWYTMTTPEGVTLQGCQWPLEQPKAVCVLVTGMMETSERYDDFARYLNSLGCSVCCLDHYGQGRNCATLDALGVWPADGFQKAIDMVGQELAQARIPGLPLYLFAHSMGSYICQGVLQQYGDRVDRVVLCGTCGKRTVAPLAAAIAGLREATHQPDFRDRWMDQLMFGQYCARIDAPQSSFDWLSRNPDNVRAYMEDPRCGYVATSHFYAAFLQGLTRLYRPAGLRRIPNTLPIFLISGTGDPSTEYGAGTVRLEQLYHRYQLNVRTRLYPGLRHELLNETERADIDRDIAAFFRLL